MDDVHSINGEHPLGLALDIVPNKAAGGTWNDIDRLAKWAEPKQNQPRPPFRWVGYDGDANHGRGHHLHLSFGHSETKPGIPAKLVQSIRCPDPIGGQTEPPTQPEPPDEPEPSRRTRTTAAPRRATATATATGPRPATATGTATVTATAPTPAASAAGHGHRRDRRQARPRAAGDRDRRRRALAGH